MAGAVVLLLFCFLRCTGAAEEESVEFLRLSSTNPTQIPLAVSLPAQQLKKISSSVLEAEAWLRVHVLSHYPASKITHIAVGHNLLCFSSSSQNRDGFQWVLASLKNLHYSLTRWGLEKEIKLSPSISPHCLEEETMDETLIKPLIEFIQTTNSTFLINSLKPFSEKSIRKFGSLDIKIVVHNKPTSRKLSSLTTMSVDPYPVRPTPLPEISPSSTPIHLSSPANAARSPLPPLIGSPLYFPPLVSTNSPPPSSSSPPVESPVFHPSPPPFGGFHLPPCNPVPVPSPAPGVGVTGEKLWCVAKPSVPVDTLQEAIDFACGEGGADCEEIQPDGSCYNPDTIIAHASYAFNSYWQKTKRHGGSCGFGGTAMIINADPIEKRYYC
ncbi:hypothetical protein V2J09_021606 [Rumex salicifolius]